MWRCIYIAALAALAASCTAPGRLEPSLPQLTPSQNRQLSHFLARHPNLRLASAAQCRCDSDIHDMRTYGAYGGPNPNYDPHLAVGDFNHDGKRDFAILLDGGAGGLVFAIFNGGQDEPAYVRGDRFDAAHIGVFPPSRDTGLLVGPFESEGCLYVPTGRSYREDCTAGS